MGRETLRPIGGEFKHSASDRRAACEAMGHPALYLNLTKSVKLGRDVSQCHCGKVEKKAPEPPK